jgi:hypothetical protein
MNSYELFLELSLELSRDDHMINFTTLQKIMQNQPYTLQNVIEINLLKCITIFQKLDLHLILFFGCE